MNVRIANDVFLSKKLAGRTSTVEEVKEYGERNEKNLVEPVFAKRKLFCRPSLHPKIPISQLCHSMTEVSIESYLAYNCHSQKEYDE